MTSYSSNKKTLNHVALIMDGNGRWAKSKNLSRFDGHKEGAKTVKKIVEAARREGLSYLTLFAFSNENWGRPETEVKNLFTLFSDYISSEKDNLISNKIRLRIVGRLSMLPSDLQKIIESINSYSDEKSEMDLILAISYGGREEIEDAVKELAKDIKSGEINCEDINQEKIKSYMYAPDLPDPDLLIRTSGEARISNFLLWQLAYTEICIVPEMWPDFSVESFVECLRNFSNRKRKYGLTEEQINERI